MEQVQGAEGLLRRITFRIGNEEWQRLDRLLKSSRHRSMSELLRAMLFKGKLTLIAHDSSLDRTMEQLSAIRTELHRIGVNINQIAIRMHGATVAEQSLIMASKASDEFSETGRKVEELLRIIKEISYRWLPE